MSTSILSNWRALVAGPFFILLSACAEEPVEKPAEKKDASTAPKLVGRIGSIPSNRKFVLIQAYGKWTVETGSVLTTLGPDGRAANLRATGEKLGQYAAADIQSGTLELGDAVYALSTLPAKTLITEESAESGAVEFAAEPESEPTTSE